jgi:hypothetical protein
VLCICLRVSGGLTVGLFEGRGGNTFEFGLWWIELVNVL